MNLNRLIIACTLLTTLQFFSCAVGQKNANTKSEKSIFPTFSWDTMPLYMHFHKRHKLTEEEVNYLAKFPLITLEKSTGYKTYEGTEEGSTEAAKAIKAINPNTKILYYKNCVINWANYVEDELFLKEHPDAYLTTSEGDFAVMPNKSKTKFFDISKDYVQAYWLDHVTKYANNPYLDGIFIDASVKIFAPVFFKHRKVGQKKRDALKMGYYEMLGELRNRLAQKKIIISNILRIRPEKDFDNGNALLRYNDGSYIEGFEHEAHGLSYAEFLAKGIANVQRAARAGNIIAMSLGIGEAVDHHTAGIDDVRKDIILDEKFNDRLDYLLAIFLVCAEKYSYVYPHDGYDVNNVRGSSASKVWLKTFPQYDKPLGPPKGPAKQEGYIYTRSFEQVDVWLDIENQKARLDWK